MLVTKHSRRVLRIQNALFIVLLLVLVGLLGWLGQRYTFQADWTASNRHTLSEASVVLLERLQNPITITSFASDTPLLRKRVSEVVDRYRQYKADIHLEFVNPELEPQRVRDLGISVDGELLVRYQQRSDTLRDISENGLSNLLQRLARSSERHIAFVTGHGERSSIGDASYDLSIFANKLTEKGFAVRTLNLFEAGTIADDTSVLVLAGPQIDLLTSEVEKIQQYITAGGNVFWLGDPGNLNGLGPVATLLGIGFYPGMIIDPNVSEVGMQLFGSDDPRIALVAKYGGHVVTRNFAMNTLFPLATGVFSAGSGTWHVEPLLQTLDNVWLESDMEGGPLTFDESKDISGPIDIALALTVNNGVAEHVQPQRIIVVGDGDFLSNGFLGVAGNLQLGMNMINWLSSDEALINIPTRRAVDSSLELSAAMKIAFFVIFLLLLPLTLIVSGLALWWRRRRR